MKFKVGDSAKMDDRYFCSMRSMITDISNAVQDGHLHLNDWETNFVSDMGGRLSAKIGLTGSQDEVLEKIWLRSK